MHSIEQARERTACAAVLFFLLLLPLHAGEREAILLRQQIRTDYEKVSLRFSLRRGYNDHSLLSKVEDVLKRADDIDLKLHGYELTSDGTGQARVVISEMLRNGAWNGLFSRDTSRLNHSVTTLQHYIDSADRKVSSAEAELVAAQDRAYRIWAWTQPEEANLLELKREEEATKAAEAAKVALQADQELRRITAQWAKADADRAMYEAQDAQRRAAMAQSEVEDARQRAPYDGGTSLQSSQEDADRAMHEAKEAQDRAVRSAIQAQEVEGFTALP